MSHPVVDIEDLGDSLEVEKKLKGKKGYENFPIWIVILTNVFQYSGVAVSAFLYFELHYGLCIAYSLMVLYGEWGILSKGCVNCYYYGKMCPCGKGKIAPLFFKKGDVRKFLCKQFTMNDFLPIMLAANGSILCGIVLSIFWFKWLYVGLTLFAVANTFYGNAAIRSKISCANCKLQDDCPAKKFFQNFGGKDKKTE